MAESAADPGGSEAAEGGRVKIRGVDQRPSAAVCPGAESDCAHLASL